MRIRKAFAILALATLAPAAAADVLRLRTGESVKGVPVQERSTMDALVVQDYLTGAVRTFSWDVVDTADRDRLWEAWQWENKVQQLVGGDTSEVYGKKVGEDDTTITVQTEGKEVKIPKSQIVSIEEGVDLDPRQIWSTKQLWDRFLDGLRQEDPPIDPSNLSTQDHWRMAIKAQWLDLLEEARDHYRFCAEDESFLKRQVAQQRLEQIDELIRDREARETLRDAKVKLNFKLFDAVRVILEGFDAKHPNAGDAVKAAKTKFEKEVAQARAEFFQKMAGTDFTKVCKEQIAKKVREKDVLITDVTSWARRELPDAAFVALAERMKKRDSTVTPEEARSFWEARPKRGWNKVNYGGGTFIVSPPKITPPKAKPPAPRRNNQGPAVQLQPPKPPTRDSWWQSAKSNERENWVLGWFVENSQLYEVGEHELHPCPLCNGVGLISKPLQTGDVWVYLCNRCGGAQNDITVKYR
jgi:hypothetical protein